MVKWNMWLVERRCSEIYLTNEHVFVGKTRENYDDVLDIKTLNNTEVLLRVFLRLWKRSYKHLSRTFKKLNIDVLINEPNLQNT
jgi:hypothetical protein